MRDTGGRRRGAGRGTAAGMHSGLRSRRAIAAIASLRRGVEVRAAERYGETTRRDRRRAPEAPEPDGGTP